MRFALEVISEIVFLNLCAIFTRLLSVVSSIGFNALIFLVLGIADFI